MKLLVVLLAFLAVQVVFCGNPKPQEPHYHEGEHNEAFHGTDPASIIDSTIDHHDVVIFSKSYCPYCRKTKALFDSLNIQYHALELDQHEKGFDIQQALAGKTGQRTVPNVFIKGHHVGGSDATFAAQKSGRLNELLSGPRKA